VVGRRSYGSSIPVYFSSYIYIYIYIEKRYETMACSG
jgi:hypothetical protein